MQEVQKTPARSNKWMKTTAVHAALIIGSLIMLLPFYWMIATSFKTYPETIKTPPTWFPSSLQFQNYVETWKSHSLWPLYFWNSFYTTMVTVILEVILSIFAAYAFSRMRFFGKNVLFFAFLATMMIPGEMLIPANYNTLSQLGWLDTYNALIIPWIVSVFAIFLLRQHFMQIPGELQEAAYLDGAGHTRFLLQIMVPLSRPPIATIALLKFIGSWNAFLWPLLVTTKPELRTVSVALFFVTSEEGPQYHIWMVAATLALLPVLIVFLAAQKQFLESVAKAGLKG